MLKADLHIHTNASDGLLTSEEVVQWAIKKRMKAIAITDHDTVNGIDKAIKAASQDIACNSKSNQQLEVIPGIELSTEYQGEEIHILGYFIDYKSTYLLELLYKIHDSRHNRAERMIDKLNSLGIEITLEQVKSIAEKGIIGRPHIARAMIDKGYIGNIKEAFDKYIGKGEPAYVERYKLTCQEAVEIIKHVGGVPVLAHPGLISRNIKLNEIMDMGIKGLEVYHSKHTDETVNKMLQIAHARKFVITGGSDCHGVFMNNEPILGSVWVDYKNVQELKELSKYFLN
ncbi:MAG: PHP domain-containing protein [Bacillota bacterium]